MELDKVQNEIVHSAAKNIIVSAGAGSGKTRVLTERVKYLIESGVSPSNIVCITFTNKAADEMKERLFDVKGIGDAFIGTIHSFANRILRASGKKYDLLTAEKEIEIIKILISKYARCATAEDYMKYLDINRQIKLGLKGKYDLQKTLSESVIGEIEALYGRGSLVDRIRYKENLETVCKKDNVITFDDLLIDCTEYFKKIKGKVEYLLVDEVQDIGMNEYEFIMALNAENLFMVGDDFQSIYSFKGGDLRIFLKLMEDPKWTKYHLAANYRNATKILSEAVKVIKQANLPEKEVYPVRADPGVFGVDSKDMISNYLRLIKKSENYKDWFILARTNKEVYELTQLCKKVGLPCTTFKQAELSREETKKIMSANSVKILTIHTSKGLENKNVIVYGNFPLVQPSYKRNSEERRILYVAMTRAMDKLLILN